MEGVGCCLGFDMNINTLIYRMNELTKAANYLKSVLISNIKEDIKSFYNDIIFIFNSEPEKEPEWLGGFKEFDRVTLLHGDSCMMGKVGVVDKPTFNTNQVYVWVWFDRNGEKSLYNCLPEQIKRIDCEEQANLKSERIEKT